MNFINPFQNKINDLMRGLQSSGLRALMYHKFSVDHRDGLTITVDDFINQINYIRDSGFTFISMKEFVDNHKKPDLYASKLVLLTIDDGYQNNADLLFPRLSDLKVPVTVFLPVQHIGKINQWDEKHESLMSLETLMRSSIGPSWVSYGLHSFAHSNYKNMTALEIANDLHNCMTTLNELELSYFKVLAYPYGGFPKSSDSINKMVQVFQNLGLIAAFRIGNRINSSLPRTPFFIERIDVRGDESFSTFKRKFSWGKLF